MGWFESFWVDLRLGILSEDERRGFFEAVNFQRRERRRPVMKPAASRI